MGKLSRDKGKRFEREVARRIREELGGDVQRGHQSRSGKDASDITGASWPFWTECKVGQRPNIIAAIKQAKRDTDGRPVLVVSKRDREETLVTMEWSTFSELLQGVARVWAALAESERETLEEGVQDDA